jgi:DNA (cytosine-5)-methyltransferase 1
MALRFGSVCSGIEAASVAWEPLGWECAFVAEIDKFPSAVLAHRFPTVPNLGDFTKIGADDVGPIDLLVGGTPCQDFSVAGLRAGMDGKRGQLTIEFVELARRVRPRWLVWENVPGVLSADDGRAFGTFLGLLGELGYGFAYRVLDAQFFGVPQRRRRVFVVGCLGDWRRAAAVLFERDSLSGHPAPRRKAGQVAPTTPSRSTAGGGLGTDFDCDGGLIPIVAHALSAQPQDRWDPSLETYIAFDTTQITSDQNRNNPKPGDPCHPLAAGAHAPTIAFSSKDHGADAGEIAPTLHAMEHHGSHANAGGQVAVAIRDGRPSSAVRRLTPRECERLQGFPDDIKSVIITVWPAKSVDEISSRAGAVGQAKCSAPVDLTALIDLERGSLRLLSRDGSLLYAGPADDRNSFRLPTRIGSFARLVALTMHTWERAIRIGVAESPTQTERSLVLSHGSASVHLSGHEIASVGDAVGDLSVATDTSITSGVGLSFLTLEKTHRTLCCSVVNAIAGFIPEQIRNAASYALNVQTTEGWTLVPYRGKPAADGPRYRALGNSMAVPVMAFIGERIAMVEAIGAAA